MRSGKTWISLVQWALFVASQPLTAEFLMVGKTITTLKRNCLGLLQELEPTFGYSVSQKKGVLYGRTIWLEGASNERAENSIRGMTLTGAYLDELTLIPEGFYFMCLSRLSEHGAKLFATTNPDSPMNYVYRKIIKNDDIDKQVEKFLIKDNTFLDPEYIRQLEKEYSGVFYQRYFLGEWVLAEGLVYPMFSRKHNVVDTVDRNYERLIVGIDYGTQNPTAMIVFGLCDGIWYAVKEYYHSGRDSNEQKTDQQYYDELVKLCDGLNIERIIIDPSAASFIALCRQGGMFSVLKAKNDVLTGIRHTAAMVDDGRLLVNDCCVNLIREFGLYSWDAKAISDTVIKANDHCLSGDTQVDTLFGKRKIKNLVGKLGLVWSYNEKKHKRVLRPFFNVRKTQTNQQTYEIICENGKKICCTNNHKILTSRGWVEAQNLTVEDEILDITNTSARCFVKIASIKKSEKQDVYNMEVMGTHNFSVDGGLIVHNCMDAMRYFVETIKAYGFDEPYTSRFLQSR